MRRSMETRRGIASVYVSCRTCKIRGSQMSTDGMDLDEFRNEVRAWLAANLKRRRSSAPQATRTETKTPEEIAESRALQRKLFDAGYAGISFPKEYGGR